MERVDSWLLLATIAGESSKIDRAFAQHLWDKRELYMESGTESLNLPRLFRRNRFFIWSEKRLQIVSLFFKKSNSSLVEDELFSNV